MAEKSRDQSIVLGLLVLIVVPLAAFGNALDDAHLAPRELPSLGLWMHGEVEAALAVVALFTAIWIHEFGHAGAALLCRQRVIAIRVGAGPVLAHIGCLEIRALPSTGMTNHFPAARRGQQAFIAAAGPLANLLLAVLAATTLSNTLATGASIFVMINAWFCVGNLIPYYSRMSVSDSDGLKIVRILRRSQNPYTLASSGPAAQAQKMCRITDALTDQGRPEEARRMLDGQ